MNKKTALLAFLLAALPVVVAGADMTLLPVEQQVSDAVNSPKTTVVHFWATWCPNCKAELTSGGWKEIIESNPDTNFVFVTLWSDNDGREILARYGIGTQKNFTLVGHPSHARAKEERVKSFMGLSVPWIPTTWIYKGGQMHYALNYGEMHFPILQQFITDSSTSWAR
jgi:thiol-disulfide isomerase/thioredoxin